MFRLIHVGGSLDIMFRILTASQKQVDNHFICDYFETDWSTADNASTITIRKFYLK